LIVVGVTGSLASGKSQVADLFRKHGAKVFDADKAAKAALRRGKSAYKAVVQIFGEDFLLKSKEVDRRKLAIHVFSHPKDLKKLNILLHPGVIFESLKVIEALKNKKGILVLDVPLLFESKMERLVDIVVVVRSSKNKMIERAVKKGMPEDLAKKVLSSQWPIEKKAKLADFVIENEGSLAGLERQVKNIIKEIQMSTPTGGNK
jgi:dephospho-CoA kinase